MTSAVIEKPVADPPIATGRPPTGPLATQSGSTQPAVRDGFLDTVRAIALVRVIIWHTFAAVAISWFVASMPAMFFVAGSLLARSFDKQPWRQLFSARLRRLLLPFWAFGAVVLSVLVLVHQTNPGPNTAISPASLIAWLFPIVDPHGSAWEGGWASTPLWYLRCYLWLLILSPLMRKAHRRFGLRILVLPVVAVFLVDFLIRHPELAPSAFTAAKYYLGDLATFSFFWMLGFSHSDGAMNALDRRARLEWAAIGGAAAAVWVEFAAPPTLIVNNSYPLLLFVGIGWLGLFLAAERWIGRATLHGLLGPVVRWLGRRSITVYLWHPIAIVGAYWLRSIFAPTSPPVIVLPVVFALVIVLSVAFGRVEDYAAGRPGQWWPGRSDGAAIQRISARLRRFLPQQLSPVRAIVIGSVAGALIVGVVVPTPGNVASDSAATTATAGGLRLPPAPSAKPDQATFGAVTTAPTSGPGTTAPAASVSAGTVPGSAAAAPTAPIISGGTQTAVQSAVDAWRASAVVDGVELGILLPDGSVMTVLSGTAPGGAALDPSAAYPTTSITKSMTAAITLQLVKEGKIALDDPLPAITEIPNLPFVGKVTIRQILNHTAGIVPYDKTPGYEAVKNGPLTPDTALQLIMDQPLEWAPGTQVGYSNSGYLILGLLDQQLTGSDFRTLLQTRIFDPAGMTGSTLDDTPSAGWTGFSAGGVVSTLADQVAWGNALYRKNRILDAGSLAQMLDINNEFSTGLGAFPTCPCSLADGVKTYSSIGHNGGQATVQYAPKEDVVIAVNLTESMWSADLTQADVADLLSAVERALTAS